MALFTTWQTQNTKYKNPKTNSKNSNGNSKAKQRKYKPEADSEMRAPNQSKYCCIVAERRIVCFHLQIFIL